MQIYKELLDFWQKIAIKLLHTANQRYILHRKIYSFDFQYSFKVKKDKFDSKILQLI